MSSRNGVAMGVDAVMDKDLYDNPVATRKEYVTSINPTGESDSDDDVMQDIEQRRQQTQSASTHNRSLMKSDQEGANFDPLSQKHKQIQSKNNEYQNRQFERGYTPARSDPFQQVVQPSSSASTLTTKKALSDSRKDIVNDQPRTYRDIMQMREVQREKQEAIDILSGKRNQFSDQSNEDKNHNKKASTVLGKRKHESMDIDNSATPAPKKSRWDATPAPQSQAWDETPHVAVAMTPIGGYGNMTPGMTPGGKTPHGSRTPGLGWNTPGAATPGGGRTPGIGYGATPKLGGNTSGRWDATPGMRGKGGMV
eukprot:45103_1